MSLYPPAPPSNQNPVLSVSQLNRLARSLLEDNFPAVLVEGEISNLSVPASGHWYLTLKDDKAQLRCAMFRNRNMFIRFRPKDGMRVQVKGRLSLYEGRGDYQLLIDTLEETGAGALRLAFEQLKARLQQEGLFDSARKRALPGLPRHVAVITSPTGAVVRDMISVLKRRFPGLPLTIVPVAVQGQLAAAEIVRALGLVNARAGCLADVDLIVLARGGGSLEDLWSFNDEGLARAIAASALPVVSAVGHETDFTIADYVADVRAPTPSAAAELLSPDQQELLQQFFQYAAQLHGCMRRRLQRHSLQLQALRRRLRHPGRLLQEQAQRLDELEARAKRAISAKLQSCEHRTAMHKAQLLRNSPQLLLAQKQQGNQHLERRLQLAIKRLLQRAQMNLARHSHALQTISPLATLARGYSITTTDDGKVLTSYRQIEPGATIRSRLDDGVLLSKIMGKVDNGSPGQQ
jgi:exodeoxyribonuclease VII large subunit